MRWVGGGVCHLEDEVADIVWSMNAPEYRALLVGARGWSAEQFGSWLADAWSRLLLRAIRPLRSLYWTGIRFRDYGRGHATRPWPTGVPGLRR